MRRFLPDVGDEPLDHLYLDLEFPDPPAERPLVYLDMVTSVDGAASVDGHTRRLGGEADRVAFSRLREWCDVVLVGAGTVRAEEYGPARPTTAARERRKARGLDPVPRIAVVTASVALNPGSRLFRETPAEGPQPLVLVPETGDAERVDALREGAQVVAVGHGRVDLREALADLRDGGVRYVLCEGGPALNAELLDLDLVDELFLTVSPQLVGESRHRIVDRDFVGAPREIELHELREHEGELLLRYRILRREGAGVP